MSDSQELRKLRREVKILRFPKSHCRVCGHRRDVHHRTCQAPVAGRKKCGCSFICGCGGASDEHSAPGEIWDVCSSWSSMINSRLEIP